MPEHGHGVVRVGPVDHQQPEVGQRVAQGADLPVEDGPDACRRRPAPRCPCGSRRARRRCAAAWGCAGPARRSTRSTRPPWSTPSTCIWSYCPRQRLSCRSMYPSCRPRSPSPTASGSTSCSAASVSAMWSPDDAPGRLVEGRLGLGRAAQDVALDELHDVEGPLVDRLVGAEADGHRDGDAGRAERVHEPVLAATCRARWAARGAAAGRRRAQARPSASSTRKVRLERPPAIRVKVSGVLISGTWATIHSVTSVSVNALRRLRHANDANRCACDPVGRPGAQRLARIPAPRTRLGPAPRRGVVRPAGAAISVMADGRHRPDIPDRRAGPQCDGAGDRGPLGPVVRALQDARADDREGRGRHGGAVELAKVNVDDNPAVAQCLQRAVHPGRLRHQRRPGGRPVHRRPARGAGHRVRAAAGARPERGGHAGRPPATRPPCARPSSSSRITPGATEAWLAC